MDLGQRSLVSCLSTFSKDFSSEFTGPVSVKFNMQLPGKTGKIYLIFGPGHMTKMATMPIYSRNLQKFLLQNHWADFLETWLEASEDLVLQSLCK